MLLYLAARHNKSVGMAWLTHRRMEEECGFSPRGLKYVLARLEKKRLIERVKGNGRGHVSLYRFPGMLSDAQKMNMESPFAKKQVPTKGAVIAPFVQIKGCKSEHSKGANSDAQRRTEVEPSPLKLTESYFGSLSERPNQPPVEKVGRRKKMTRVAGGSLQRAKKAYGLPDAELHKLASDLSELGLVRRAGCSPLEVARCLVNAARSQVPNATGGGIFAAAIEASKLPDGYTVNSPMRWLMANVRDRFKSLALYPDGKNRPVGDVFRSS